MCLFSSLELSCTWIPAWIESQNLKFFPVLSHCLEALEDLSVLLALESPGICSHGPCVTASPHTPSPAGPALPNHPSSWTWPCAYQLLKLDVNDQIYSNIFKCHWPNIFKFQTQTPAQVPVFCITPMQCQVAVEQLFFSSCSFLKFHSGSGVKWRLPFSVYKLAKNCWVATFIKFPFSLHWLRAFLTLKMFFSLIICKLWS